MGSEITNNQNLNFLVKVSELGEAYSSCFVDEQTTRRRFLGKSKQVWNEKEGKLRGADPVMEKFLFENKLILPELEDEARTTLSRLKESEYGFKRDVVALHQAVARYSDSHAPNAYYRKEYRQMLEVVKAQLKPRYTLYVLEFRTVAQFKKFLSNPKASTGLFSCYTDVQHKGDLDSKKMLDVLTKLEAIATKKGTMCEPTLPGIRLQVSMPFDENGELTLVKLEDGTDRVLFKYKTRLINMVSLPRIFMEMHYSVECQMYFGELDWYAGGKSTSNISRWINSKRRKYAYFTTLDYSSYDQSLPGWFIRDAFRIIKEWYEMDEMSDARYETIVNDFINKQLVCDVHGNVAHIVDGVESGSMFTQIIDTLCNYMMVIYFAILSGKRIGIDFNCHICGDDNIVFHDGWFIGRNYLNCIRKVFGVRGNFDKSKFECRCDDVDPEYLSREWRWNGVYRYWKELLVKLVYHERFRFYDEDVTPAQIFKAYDDCYHLGMLEGFDLSRFDMIWRSRTHSGISIEDAKAIGGIVEYEYIYGRSVLNVA